MVCKKEEEIRYEKSQDEKENDDYDGTSCGCDDTRRRQLFIGCGAAHTGGDQYDGNNADVDEDYSSVTDDSSRRTGCTKIDSDYFNGIKEKYLGILNPMQRDRKSVV